MKLEAVVICINYSDFLRITLPQNKAFFERIVVVTDTTDTETARVCEFNNVQCIMTDIFYADPTKRVKPNKANGITEGLKHLDKDGWVLQLDADMWLPALFRQILEDYPLDPNCLYGMDRLMCNSYAEWINYVYNGKPLNEGWIYVHTNQFPMGERIVKYHSHGYIPIGFFQLWNPSVSGVIEYPQISASFEESDILFAQQFSRANRRLIADFVGIHLASETTAQGQNWQGRKTRPFQRLTVKDKALYQWNRLRLWATNLVSKEKRTPNATYAV